MRPAPADLAGAVGPLVGADLVDLGCGDGALARWAVRRGAASVLALGLDLELLARARVSTTVTEASRIHVEQADLDQATLPFEAYDVATCLVLDELEDPERFARMVRAGLRPGARLVAWLQKPGDRVRSLEQGGLQVGSVSPASPTMDAGLLVVARKPPRGR